METLDFSQWLMEWLDKKGWSRAEFSRRSGISAPQITRIINREQGPGEESLTAFAHALNLPPEEVFRAAGKLPPDPDKPPGFDEWVYLYMTADEAVRNELLAYARLGHQRRPITG